MSILSEIAAIIRNKFEEQQEQIDSKANQQSSNDIEITSSTNGIILRSPNGTRYRITIDDEGNLNKEAIE
jgi:hypothetical protein